MPLHALLDIAAENDRFRSLSTAVRAGGPVKAHMSAAVQPFLLAALVAAEHGLAGRPALIVTPDDRSARDLARELGAFLAPRAVRYYPSRGTGYESHVAPPAHLVGLRIAALDALTGSERAPAVVASAVALAEAVPDASLRPAGFRLSRDDEVDLDSLATRLVACGYERADQVEERGQFAIRGGLLDVFGATEERAARIELFGDDVESVRWFSTFTQRSLGETESVELAPAAELDVEHRELAELALAEARAENGNGAGPSADIADVLPTESFAAPLDLLPAETAVILAGEQEIDPALSDHWDDVTIAMHADDARHLYVDVAEPLRARAALSIRGRVWAPVQLPRPAPLLRRAQLRRGRVGARARASLRIPDHGHVRAPGRGRARATTSTASRPGSSTGTISRARRGSPATRAGPRSCSPRRRSPTGSSRRSCASR